MNESPWDILIQAHLDDSLDESGQADFSALMVESAAARQRFWELAEIHSMVSLAYQRESALTAPEHAANVLRLRRSLAWQQWRPLAQAAVGVLLGVLSTSIVLAYGYSWMTKTLLPLANAGFEKAEAILPKPPNETAPSPAGVWVGQGEVHGAQSGMPPLEGKQMLRFLPSTPAPAKFSGGGMASGAFVMQIIDIRPWRTRLADGTARVDWSAAFNGLPEPAMKNVFYRIDVRACIRDQQSPGYDGAVAWGDGLRHVAHSVTRTPADNNPSKWEILAGSISIPPEADCIAIYLRVFADDRRSIPDVSPDLLHFVDDVHLSLTTSSNRAPIALISATP